MKTPNLNLQDVFLNQVRRERVSVTVYLTNGFQFRGVVRGFDSFIVLLENDGKQNLVYKHAISTIIPVRPVDVMSAAGAEDAAVAGDEPANER